MNLRTICQAALRDIACLLLLCLTAGAHAQYHYNVWTAEDGLPQNEIRGIAQTPDGYLWIATLDGLARFDGVRFTLFNRSNTRGIASNLFGGMLETPNGDLWLPAEGRQLTRYHNGTFQTFDVSVQGITSDDNGHIWIMEHGKISQWNDTAARFLDATPAQPQLKYHILQWQNSGFWTVDRDRIYCFEKGNLVNYPLPRAIKPEAIGLVAADQDYNLWLETRDGGHLRISHDGASGPLLNSGSPATYSLVDANGHTWSISVGPHLSQTIQFQSSGQMAQLGFTRFYEDHEKNLWLGTEGQGLYRLQRQSIQVLSKDEGLGSGNIYPIFQDRDGAVWIGAWASGVARYAQGKFTNFTPADGLPSPLPTAIAQGQDGRIWVGSHGGLRILVGKHFELPPGPQLPPETLVEAIYQDRAGILWFGTSTGLVSYRDGQQHLFTVRDGLATNDVRTIIADQEGGLWIGGYGGLTHFQNGKFSHWTERDGLPSNTVRSLYEDSAGVLWIGTYDGGLGRLKDHKFTRYTEQQGLFSNGVFQILEDAAGRLWMTSNHGIYRVSKEELNQYAAGTRESISSIPYGKADGLLTVECNGGLWPAGTKTSDGKLWFPTQNGVAIIDTNDIRQDTQPPPVVIESLIVDSVPVPVSGTLRLNPGSENVQIQYTALSFIHSDQIHFRYRLEGLQSQWVEAGSRRAAYYSHIPPGKYTFHVLASSSDGLWNLEGKSLTFTVLAPFYRTWWFVAILLLTFLGLSYVTWLHRIAQLQHKQLLQQAFSQKLIASQENERKRIAAELHDSIGQRLVVINNIALFFLRSHRNTTANEDDTLSIREISSEALSAIEEARAISYNLRPFQLDRLGLTKAIEGIVRSVSRASSMTFTSQIADVDDIFPEDMRINFYRIVQESLTNAIKHSHATEVTLRVEKDDSHVILSVHDNGSGFNTNANLGQSGVEGFGMTGMAERARLLGGRFDIHSTPGHGTVLTVTIPISGNRHV